jgi:hypothetical protein
MERKTPFKKKYMASVTLTKKQKISGTSKIAGVVAIGIFLLRLSNRVVNK